MKKFIGIALLILLAFSANVFAQAKFEIEGGDTYNWGVVKAVDSPLKTEIKLFNRGTDTLKIFNVKAACGCTAKTLDKESIEPGGFATLGITLNIGGYSGNIHKTVSIRTSDPEKSNVTLNLKANVFEALSQIPKYLNFGNMMLNKETKTKITLRNNTDTAITLKFIRSEPEDVKLNLKNDAVIPAKSEISLEATVTPVKVGAFNASVQIKTDHPDASKITISSFGQVLDEAQMEQQKTPKTIKLEGPKTKEGLPKPEKKQ